MIVYFSSDDENFKKLIPINGIGKKYCDKAYESKELSLKNYIKSLKNRNITNGNISCYLYTCETLNEENSGYLNTTFARIIKKEYVSNICEEIYK